MAPRITALPSRFTPEQLIVVGSLLVAALASWLLSFLQLGPMMNMTAFPINPVSLTVFASSWTVGMVAMMFPTSVPMMLVFFNVAKAATPEIRAGGGPTMTKAALFITSYIAIWGSFGVLVYLALAASSNFLQLEAFFEGLMSPLGASLALLIVGFYQLSPIKGECLDRCHPTNFLFKYYRGGRIGAAVMGILYAKYCVGCCWVMMIFLLLIGAMGPLWMVLFASIIFTERALVHGPWPSRLIGLIFLSAGIIRLLIS